MFHKALFSSKVRLFKVFDESLNKMFTFAENFGLTQS
jgi:hypothetical protein